MRIQDTPFGATLAESTFTDIGISLTNLSEPTAWLQGVPGAPALTQPPPHLYGDLISLAEMLRALPNDKRADFSIRYQEQPYRGRRVMTSDGARWFVLRRVPSLRPSLNGEGSRISRLIAQLLMGASSTPGLVLLVGQPRQGKTYTAVSTYTATLENRGGPGVAIEDPVEFDLNGRFGEAGWGLQIDVSGTENGYADAIKGAFRLSSSLAYIGEIRTPEVASEVLRFAAGAFTVISTMHAADPVQGIQRLISLAAQRDGEAGARHLVASGVNAVVAQSMSGYPPTPQFRPLFIRTSRQFLTQDNERSIRSIIQRGELHLLENEMRMQDNRYRTFNGQMQQAAAGAGAPQSKS